MYQVGLKLKTYKMHPKLQLILESLHQEVGPIEYDSDDLKNAILVESEYSIFKINISQMNNRLTRM